MSSDLSKILASLSNPALFDKIEKRIEFSILQNFRQEGRPDKWKPSLRALGKARSKKDGKYRSGKTLQDTGLLRNSIQSKFENGRIVVGSSMVYARNMQEGIPNRNVAARPYLMLQQDDIDYIVDIITKGFEK